jgi:peptidoglycan/xylan/chitin deacetylase (PgdA/CDA1 family)
MMDRGFRVFSRTPASPLRSGRRHAVRLLVLPIAVVMATGAVAASAITAQRDGAPTGAGTGSVATLRSSRAPGGAAASSSAPQATVVPTDITPGTLPAQVPRVIRRGSAAKLVVALTFDDGWSAKNGHTILRILLREQVKATFFVNSVWLATDPGLWQSIANAGFVVGNHTYLHGDATKMTAAALERDLQRNARVWEAVTGTKMAPLFRPPYGYRNAATDLAAAQAGFPDVILWDVDPKDTSTGPFTYAQMAHNASMGRAGSIVLLHVGPDATTQILERVIANYRARGFTFVTVPELLGQAVPAPTPTPTSSPPAPSAAIVPAGPRLAGFPR